jgi:hypothetical protein
MRFSFLMASVLALSVACIAPAQVTFSASPNPFAPDANGRGQLTLTWSAPGATAIEIRLHSPTGPLLALAPSSQGTAATGEWVTDGMTFYLQNVSAAVPGTTLATVTAYAAGLPGLPPNSNVLISTDAGQNFVYAAPGVSDIEIHVLEPDGPLLARPTTNFGTAPTGSWVRDGMRFFLQDVSNGKPLTYANTLASGVAVVDAAVPGHNSVVFGPTPAVVLDNQGTGLGVSSLYWNAPGSSAVEIRVGAPNGTLFASVPPEGFATTGDWVNDGMQFFLQDASSGDPTSSANTLAVTTVAVQSPLQHYVAIIGKAGYPEVYSRDSGYILNIVPLPSGVTGVAMHSGPDGSLLYVLGSDANFYVINPAALQIQSTLPTSTAIGGPAAGISTFTWITGPQGQNLILTGASNTLARGASADLYALDPELGSVVGTVTCNCGGWGAPTYNPYNQNSYMPAGGTYTVIPPAPAELPVITANLQLGPSLQVTRPTETPAGESVNFGYNVTPFIMSGGTQGQILISWQDVQIPPSYGEYIIQTALIDPASNLQKDLPLPLTPELPGYWLPLIVSPDGQSYFAQWVTIQYTPAGTADVILGALVRVQVSQNPDGSATTTQAATASLPETSQVTQGPFAFDDRYAYLAWQYYSPLGNVFLYRADPNTLQPVGSTNFIDTLIQQGPVLSGSLTGVLGPVTGVSVGTYTFNAQ